MSHFTVLVAVDGETKPENVEGAVEQVLAPYWEELEVPRYIAKTREQAIAEERKDIESMRDGFYAEYLADPAAYDAKSWNKKHVAYLREEFPTILARIDDDEFVFQRAAGWYEPEDIDTEGNIWSEVNPDGKWDWWTIGGRWDGLLNNTQGRKADKWDGQNILRVRDMRVPESTYAYVDLDGSWHGKGDMGWFGLSSGDAEQEVWDKEMAEWQLGLPRDTWLVVVDCHC